MTRWIDSHCHLDAFEFTQDVDSVRAEAQSRGVEHCVIPAVEVANFDRVRLLAHQYGDSYALGIHPLYVPSALEEDLQILSKALLENNRDPRLIAVGEIGLDFFEPHLCTPEMREKQLFFYRAQLRLAKLYQLPVIMHVRRSADFIFKGLREIGSDWRGIAHAFNGSDQQAQRLVDMGIKLGFGGSVTFERALQIRRLVTNLPLSALVLETDAPDIPPHWLYQTFQARAYGHSQGRNTPGQLPKIAEVVASLREISLANLSKAVQDNSCFALPKLSPLLDL